MLDVGFLLINKNLQCQFQNIPITSIWNFKTKVLCSYQTHKAKVIPLIPATASKHNTHTGIMIHTRFPLTSKRTLLRPQYMFKVSKIVCAIAVSNEYMSKILGNYVSICPLFLTPTETLDTHTHTHTYILG